VPELRPNQLQDLRALGAPEACLWAMERAGLSEADALTVRDVLEAAGCPGDAGAAALLTCLFLALREGHLSLPLEALRVRRCLESFLPPTEEEPGPSPELLLEALERGRFDAFISRDPNACVPVILQVEDGVPRLYFQKYWRAARRLGQRLDALLSRPALKPADGDLGRIRTALNEVLVLKPIRNAQGDPLQFNAGQIAAVALALLSDFLIISGGPGVGKTSVIVCLLRCLSRLGWRPGDIRMAAPTGLAAQRIQDSIRLSLNSAGPLGPEDEALMAIEPATIHRILQFRPSRNNFFHTASRPLPIRALIVDETSMIDATLMAALLDATPPDARLILIGDRDQLPPVEAGAPFRRLVGAGWEPGFSPAAVEALSRVWPEGCPPAEITAAGEISAQPAATAFAMRDRFVLLSRNYRSAPDIQSLAALVNAGDLSAVEWLEPRTLSMNWTKDESGTLRADVDWSSAGEVRWLRLESPPPRPALEEAAPDASPSLPAAIALMAASWAEAQYLRAPMSGERPWRHLVREALAPSSAIDSPIARQSCEAIVNGLNRARALTILREGPFGAGAINAAISRFLRPHLDPVSRGPLFAGQIIMIVRNDYDAGLFNGQVGVVLRGCDGAYRAVFPRPEGPRAFALEALPPFETAFATTVHKSQGSEYDHVWMILPPDPAQPLLSREILFTGLTRARRGVVISGGQDVLRSAIERARRAE